MFEHNCVMFRNRSRLMECCVAFKYFIAYHTRNNTCDSSSSSAATAAEDHLQQTCSILMGTGLPPLHWLIYIMFVINTYLLTPWSIIVLEKLNWFASSQEIPCILWNPKVRYYIYKCLPPVPILSQLDPVHTPTSHFLKIHLNIILPSEPGSPQWYLSLRFPHQNPLHASPLPHTSYMPRPSHSS